MKAFYEHILENHPDMILVKATNSRIVWANKAFREMYAMTNDQLRGLIDGPFNDSSQTQQYVQDDIWVRENRRPMQIDCETVTRYDGTPRKFSTLKYPLLDEKGDVIYTVGVSRDITSSIDLEQSAQHHAKMASLGEMASNIAHEINNPLTVVIGKANQLIRAISEDLQWSDVKILSNLKAIVDYSERIDKIIRGLKKFSRDGSGDAFETVNLKALIEDTLTLCKGQIAQRDIDMEIEIPEDTRLECRPVQISQILLNLINNAVDALESMPKGSERKIWIRGAMNEKTVSITVRDSGPGVAPSLVNKIMQPFFTTKKKGKGTGLGLSVSAQLAKDHGGSLKLDLTISPSCFHLTLPKFQKDKPVPTAS